MATAAAAPPAEAPQAPAAKAAPPSTEPVAGPESAKVVISDGVDAPVVTDGPFPEMKEFLAGFWLIDVDSEKRAIEIAARTSAAPGPGGRPTRYPIEVRAIMSGPDPEL